MCQWLKLKSKWKHLLHEGDSPYSWLLVENWNNFYWPHGNASKVTMVRCVNSFYYTNCVDIWARSAMTNTGWESTMCCIQQYTQTYVIGSIHINYNTTVINWKKGEQNRWLPISPVLWWYNHSWSSVPSNTSVFLYSILDVWQTNQKKKTPNMLCKHISKSDKEIIFLSKKAEIVTEDSFTHFTHFLGKCLTWYNGDKHGNVSFLSSARDFWVSWSISRWNNNTHTKCFTQET